MYATLAVLAAFATVYSAVAGRIEKSWVSGPIIFTAFGLALGPMGFGLIDSDSARNPELLRTLAELTLALVLFTDAARTDLAALRRARALPFRLLAVGLPLTILFGLAVGQWLFPGLDVFAVALIATMLAPTDAALGKPVVSNPTVPSDVREALNVESGLNDGICVPILFLFLALALGTAGSAWETGLTLFASSVGIGLVCGLALSALAVGLLRLCNDREWLSPTWTKVTVIALALTCFGASQALGGSGFIAAFVGGLLFGTALKPYHAELLDAGEGIGDLFALLTWVLFGAAVAGPALGGLSWQTVLYALFSLTLLRMLPVYLVTGGLQRSMESRLFVGWFGPRGLASVVFVVIVLNAGVAGAETIAEIVGFTVLLSIVAHGVSAVPWAKAFGARAGSA